MANYKYTFTITNKNGVAVTCKYGFSSSMSNTATIGANSSSQLTMESDNPTGQTIYTQFVADGYNDSEVASTTAGTYNPYGDIEITIGTATGSTTKTLYFYNKSPQTLTIKSLNWVTNTIFGVSGNDGNISWNVATGANATFKILSNEKITICSYDGTSSQTYKITVQDGAGTGYSDVTYTNA